MGSQLNVEWRQEERQMAIGRIIGREQQARQASTKVIGRTGKAIEGNRYDRKGKSHK